MRSSSFYEPIQLLFVYRIGQQYTNRQRMKKFLKKIRVFKNSIIIIRSLKATWLYIWNSKFLKNNFFWAFSLSKIFKFFNTKNISFFFLFKKFKLKIKNFQYRWRYWRSQILIIQRKIWIMKKVQRLPSCARRFPNFGLKCLKKKQQFKKYLTIGGQKH